VGLLTGDTSYNRNADIIVMTTEVLRNMLLTESQHLTSLGLVVLDEVHYLQDPFRGGCGRSDYPHAVRGAIRGAVGHDWQRQLPGEWFAEVRGPTSIVSKRHDRSSCTTTWPSFAADSPAPRSWICSTATGSRKKLVGLTT